MSFDAGTAAIGSVSTTQPIVASATIAQKLTPALTTPSLTAQATTASSTVASSSSPKVVVDPSSGTLITQFLGVGGSVQSQVPSSAALAYIRAGLTADGFSRQPPYVSLNQNTGDAVEHQSAFA